MSEIKISFRSGGFFFWWQAGVLMSLQKYAPEKIKHAQFHGCSAGSIIAALASCRVNMDLAKSKALELADKTPKTVLIVRNHLFSEFHTRSFFNLLLQIIKENKILYRIYIEILAGISLIKSKQKIGRYDEEYFDSKYK